MNDDPTSLTDDFERFCQMAHGSPQRNASESSGGADFLAAPQPNMRRSRASSMRETRRRNSLHPNSVGANGAARLAGGSRSPNLRSGNATAGSMFHPAGSNRTALGPSPQHGFPDNYPANESRGESRLSPRRYSTMSPAGGAPSPGKLASPDSTTAGPDLLAKEQQMGGQMANSLGWPESLASRSRSGSMKEGRMSSACQQLSPTLAARQTRDSLGVIRVRSFRRTKNGQVVSQGDRAVITSTPAARLVDSTGTRRSINTGWTGQHGNEPCLVADETPENDFLELPAITTTQASPRAYHHHHHPTHAQQQLMQQLHQKQPTLSHLAPMHSASLRSISMAQNEEVAAEINLALQRHRLSGSTSQMLRVQVIGAEQVGKTSLCEQFLSSESLDDGFDSMEENGNLKTVTVEIDEQETSLLFLDTNIPREEIEDGLMQSAVLDSAEAYIIVYAIDDRSSFHLAQTLLELLLGQVKRSSAMVLVANKADLVRTRTVSTEDGKNLASAYSAGFFEVSVSLNHRVDELLVGLVGQIEAGHRRVEEDRVRATRLATSVGIVRDSISFPGGATGDNGFSGEGDQILGGAGLGSTPGSRKQSLRAKTGGGISRFFKRHFYRGNGDGET